MKVNLKFFHLLIFLFSLTPRAALPEEALIAVAANFAEVAERLAADFERNTGYTITLTIGSTGKLYAQIKNGAPFDILLAADQERPEKLAREGTAVEHSRFSYAFGLLTLWSRHPKNMREDGARTLRKAAFRTLAIANPDLAPYGVAARETLIKLKLYEALHDKIVMGENVGQTFAMISTGNSELGFVALSSVLSPRNKQRGERWDVPTDLYLPIRQDAVLLVRAEGNTAAKAFLEFLRSDHARSVIESFGYGVE